MTQRKWITLILFCITVASVMLLLPVSAHAAGHTDHCCCTQTATDPNHTCEENVTWEPFSTATLTDGGHYYLDENRISKAVVVGSKMEVTVCLNGNVLQAQKVITVYNGGVLNICDCGGNGSICSTRLNTEGYIVKVGSGGQVNLYSGKLTGKTTQGNTVRCVVVRGGTFNMYGGTVTGGCSDATILTSAGKVADTDLPGYGGNVLVYNNGTAIGTFRQYGGDISGGNAKSGGNMYIQGGKAFMYGGSVTGGTADGTASTDLPYEGSGGNIYITSDQNGIGNLTVSGSMITDGKANTLGGNIGGAGQSQKAQLTIDGTATVSGGAAESGGNLGFGFITNGVVVYINGGTVCDGSATADGGNLYSYRSPAYISGGTIKNGTAKSGGNISGNGAVTMSGGSVVGGQADQKGGSVYVGKGATFIMEGGSINGGKIATKTDLSTGGNVFVEGTFTMEDGEILNGYSYKGGNLQVQSSAKVTINGGQIYNGSVGAHGGNVLCYGSMTVTGGTIRDGRAEGGGGNIYLHNTDNSTLTINGGTISGGVSKSSVKGGGNIFVGGTAKTQGRAYLTVGSAAVIRDGTALNGGRGGNLTVANGATVVLDSCKLTGGSPYDLLLWRSSETYAESEDAAATRYKGGPSLELKGQTDLNMIWDNQFDEVIDGNACYATLSLNELTEQTRITLAVTNPTGEYAYVTIDKDYTGRLYSGMEGYVTAYENGFMRLAIAENLAAKVYDGDRWIADCTSFTDALSYEGGYIKLLQDVDAQGITVSDLYIDLNGFDLQNICVTGTLYGLDSTTDSYDGSNAGTLSNVTGTVAPLWRSTTARLGAAKRYLTVEQQGGYSFHRFYVGITKLSVAPNSAGAGYTAVFAGDDAVKAQLSDDAFGFVLWVEGGTPVCKGFTADALDRVTSKKLLLQNIMTPGGENNVQNATTDIYGQVYICFEGMEPVYSATCCYDLRQITQMADASFTSFNSTQQAALQNMYRSFETEMKSWQVANTRHHVEGKTPWDGVSAEGVVYLAEDLVLNKTVNVAQGKSLTLCLNGHTLSSNLRVFEINGTLTICDCGNTGLIQGKSTSLAPLFYVNQTGSFNLEGGTLQATSQVKGSIGIGTVYGGTMNMSAGSIFGGRATSNVGGISVQALGRFNMTGGQIYDCASGGNGGCIQCISGTVNLEGGKIYNGSAKLGGDIYMVNTAAELIVGERTVISGGTAETGGNIYANNSNISVLGAVSGGTAKNGGNIALEKSANTAMTVEILGDITGGAAENDGGNLYAVTPMHNRGNLTPMELTLGGTLTEGQAQSCGGDVYVTRCQLSLSGTIDIDEMYLGAGQLADTQQLLADSSVGVTMEQPGTITKTNNAALAGCFTSDQGTPALHADKLTLATFEAPQVNGFSAGFARVCITPQWAMPLDGMNKEAWHLENWQVISDIHASMIVLADGEDWNNTVVLCSIDILYIYDDFYNQVSSAIGDALNIPEENVFFTATHNHYSVDLQYNHENVKEYLEWFYPAMAQTAQEAAADLSPVAVSVGSLQTEKLVFNRRFVINDEYGTYISGAGTDPKVLKALWEEGKLNLAEGETTFKVAKYATEVDEQLQAILFDRADGDILMLNFQFHPGNVSTAGLGACRIAELQEQVEQTNPGVRCAIFQGAQGDTTSSSQLTDAVVGTDYYGKTDYIAAFDGNVSELLTQLKPVRTGTIHVVSDKLAALKKGSETDYYQMTVSAVAFGDVSFVTFPYELFSSNAMELKAQVAQKGLFEMTFVCGITNGMYRYMADEQAWASNSTNYSSIRFPDKTTNNEDSFEIRETLFVRGTAEAVVQWHLEQLEKLSALYDN